MSPLVFAHLSYSLLFVSLKTRNFTHSDDSGTITYDEFRNVFNAAIGPESTPFDFDWYVLIPAYEIDVWA